MPSSTRGARERPAEGAQARRCGQRRPLDAPQQRRAVRRVHVGEGGEVGGARVAAEQLRVALDAVEERGAELRPHLEARRPRGTRSRSRRSRRSSVRMSFSARVVAGPLRMVVDHDVDREHARAAGSRRRPAAARRRARARRTPRAPAAVIVRTSRPSAATMARFSGRVTAPKETRGAVGELAAEQRAQRVARGDAVGVGIRLEQDRDLLAVLEQLAQLHHPAQVARGDRARARRRRGSASGAPCAAGTGRAAPPRARCDPTSAAPGRAGSASATAARAARAKGASSVTSTKSSPSFGSSFRIDSRARPAREGAEARRAGRGTPPRPAAPR